MKKFVINNIEFTPTETKVLACFVDSDATKPSAAAKILGTSLSTIYSHIDKIKAKIGVQSIDNISMFLKKSAQFKILKLYFIEQYIDYCYRLIANKIAYKLQPLSLVCNLILSPTFINNISIKELDKCIYLLGIQIKKMNVVPCFKEVISSSNKEFVLFVTSDAQEKQEAQKIMYKTKQNNLCLALNAASIKEEYEAYLISKQKNKIEIYKNIINYLITHYKTITNFDEAENFLIEIDNIYKNIQVNTLEKQTIESSNSKNCNRKTRYLLFKRYRYVIGMIVLVVGGCALIAHYVVLSNQYMDNKLNFFKKRKTNEILAYSLPPRNNKFIGRENIFTQIRNNLKKSNMSIITQTIVGMGGIGKTQLATEYAYQAVEQKDYDSVLWVTAETQNSISDIYNEFAYKLKLNTYGIKDKDIRAKVHNELIEKHNVKRILFVFDNVPDEQFIKTYISELHAQWGINIKPHILITSRSQHWLESSSILDVFSKEEAQKFVRKYLPNAPEQSIDKLIISLHYFPLTY